MSHEQSETIQQGKSYRNIYGKNVGPRAGMPIPHEYEFEKTAYSNLQEALGSAIVRSELEGQRHSDPAAENAYLRLLQSQPSVPTRTRPR